MIVDDHVPYKPLRWIIVEICLGVLTIQCEDFLDKTVKMTGISTAGSLK